MTSLEADVVVKPGQVLLGKYRVERVIGVGGMGFVVDAWHLDFEERVAIKFLLASLASNEEAVARFEREARVLFKIKSENVVRVIDVGKLKDNGIPFMVMEFLDGYDLATLLERREPVAVDRAVDFALQACQALANAHVRGIVHRDLKPENLYVAEAPGGDQLKLLDFGLSKEKGGDQTLRQRKLTANEQVMGTPHYMSPEQWMSSKDVGPPADQWALGAILFELLTGLPPFDGEQIANICAAVINEPTPSLTKLRPDAPPGLDLVLRKALEKRPHERYENVGAFAVALAAFASPGVGAKAERTLKMLKQAKLDEDDVSGSWQVELPRHIGASDMRATVPKPPQFELFQQVRTITSTSWQSLLQKKRQRSSQAAIGIGAMLVFGAAIGAIIAVAWSQQPDTVAPAARHTGAETTSPVPSDKVIQATSTETAPEATGAVSADASSEPETSSSAKTPAKTVPRAKQKRRAKATQPKPKTETPKPAPPTTPQPTNIFEERW